MRRIEHHHDVLYHRPRSCHFAMHRPEEVTTLTSHIRPDEARRSIVRGLPLTLGTLAVMLGAVTFRTSGPFVPGAGVLLFTALAWLPLLLRTIWPLRVLIATVALEAVQIATLPWISPDWHTVNEFAAFQPVPVATVTAAFTVALRCSRRTAWLAGGASALVLPLLALLLVGDQASDYAFTILVMANLVIMGTTAGAIVNGRRERAASEKAEHEERTRRAVEDERVRIARDLHDVVAHHLTLVDAQVSVAGYLVRHDPDAAATSLSGLARHTRLALDELRATVGLLRAVDQDESATRPPTPGIGQVPQLVESLRAAGTKAQLLEHGQARPLSPRADVAAYRIAQEALTNATKHAPGAPVTVELSWTEHHVVLSVTNPVPANAPADHRGAGTRTGLLGMDERASAAGGTVEHGPAPYGGFRVRATLPVHHAPAEDIP